MIVNIPINLRSGEEIGYFIYKIHAMIGTTPEKCLEYVADFLDIENKNGIYGYCGHILFLALKRTIHRK